MNRIKQVLALVGLIGISGCAAANANWAKQRSTGHVPCASDDINVHDMGGVGTTWVAECKGRRYFCSFEYGGAFNGGRVSCIPES